MDQINWGILSTAEIARMLTIPAIQRAENADLLAIASLSGKEASVSSSFGIPKKFSNYEDLLNDPEVDAVYIPLPNNLHARWVIEAARKGKHVLCEKPAALTASEAKEMIKVCQENNVVFMETFMYQYHPQNQRVRDIIASGEIGDVKLMRSSCSFYLKNGDGNFRLNANMGGGSLYDLGCYCIHSIRNILKAEPTSVYTKANLHPDSQIDISATGILEFERGVKGVFDCGMDRVQHMHYEVIGTKGMIQIPRAFRPDLTNGEGLVIVTDEDGRVRKESIFGDEYKLAVEHFLNCVMNGIQPFYTPEHTIQNMNVLDACFASLSEGQEVKVQ
jgi:xylose dehydrogenase (NAD/NADP)